MNRIRRAILGLALLASVLVGGCGKMRPPWEGKGGPPRVLVTFAPLASFARAIGGDQAAVMSLCDTTGPHDYQFSIEDAIKLRDADLFVANGQGMDDHFADRLKANSGNPRLVFDKLADKLSAGLLKKNEKYVPGQEHKHEKGVCDCAHGPNDPHVWLGLPQSIEMVRQLRDDFKTVDPTHAADYQKRGDCLVKELEALLAEGKKSLKKLDAPLIVSHEAMGYFADSFALTVIGSFRGLDGSPGDNKTLARLTELCAGHDRVILTIEPQYPKTDAEVLKKELIKRNKNCEVILIRLDSLETSGGEEVTGEWYVNKMRQNIEALAKYAR